MAERYRVFVGEASEGSAAPLVPAGYTVALWRPSWRRPIPPGDALPRLYAWWLMHQLHAFRNRSYAAVVVRAGDAVVHRALAFPPYFAFPFMGRDDLQIGLVWTEPTHRRRGLAAFAIREILSRLGRPGRRFWYLTEEDNDASARTAGAAGLVAVGEALHLPRWGVRRLGSYALAPAGSVQLR